MVKISLFLASFFGMFFLPLNAKDDSPKLINSEISDWDARLEYARLLSYMQRYDESLEQFKILLEEKPEAIEPKIEIAKILYYQKNYQEALNWINKIPNEDQNVKISILVGDIFVALKKYSKAESIYREVINTTPDDDSTIFKLAELLSWEKKYSESLSLYKKLLQNNPNDIQIRRKYAMVLLWMGNEKEAAIELEKTLK